MCRFPGARESSNGRCCCRWRCPPTSSPTPTPTSCSSPARCRRCCGNVRLGSRRLLVSQDPLARRRDHADDAGAVSVRLSAGARGLSRAVRLRARGRAHARPWALAAVLGHRRRAAGPPGDCRRRRAGADGNAERLRRRAVLRRRHLHHRHLPHLVRPRRTGGGRSWPPACSCSCFVLVLLERWSRGRAQYFHTSSRYRELPSSSCTAAGAARLLACALPVVLGFCCRPACCCEMHLREGDPLFGTRFWALPGTA
jgi:hypothetical protein